MSPVDSTVKAAPVVVAMIDGQEVECLTGPSPPPVRPPHKRAGTYLLEAAYMEAGACARGYDDALVPGERARAEELREAVFGGVPGYMAEVGKGRELIPASKLGENPRALELRDTVSDPHYVTVEASRDRLAAVNEAGALEMGLDAAETIGAQNSLEKMLAHQMAATHRATMRMTAQLNERLDLMGQSFVRGDEKERANVQATRLAGAIARMNGSFQSGLLTIERLRRGGKQSVTVTHVHQQVQVNDGGQALVAGEINGADRGRRQKRKGTGHENGK